MTQSDYMQDRAAHTWGESHPIHWPRPPKKMPRWFNVVGWIEIRGLEEVFGHIDQIALDRFWAERSKGQSVYEDAGGYMLRCYEALAGFSTEEPYEYDKAARDFINGRA